MRIRWSCSCSIRRRSAGQAAEIRSRAADVLFRFALFTGDTVDLSITGMTRDGREVPVFVNGNFAF